MVCRILPCAIGTSRLCSGIRYFLFFRQGSNICTRTPNLPPRTLQMQRYRLIRCLRRPESNQDSGREKVFSVFVICYYAYPNNPGLTQVDITAEPRKLTQDVFHNVGVGMLSWFAEYSLMPLAPPAIARPYFVFCSDRVPTYAFGHEAYRHGRYRCTPTG